MPSNLRVSLMCSRASVCVSMCVCAAQVRKTLSHSLHELARMLGPAHSATYLVPAFHTFLRDIDEVRQDVFL